MIFEVYTSDSSSINLHTLFETKEREAMARVRKDTTKYNKNPWIEKAALQTVQGSRIITAKGDSSRKLIVSSETGEVEGFSGFYTKKTVDKSKFVKLYADGIRAFTGLSAPGMKVFMIVYDMVSSKDGINNDTVPLNYALIDKEKYPYSKASFFRGISDLLKCEFLAETVVPSVYYINPTYFYNGDRLALVTEYFVQKEPKPIDLFEEEENNSDTLES